MEDYWCRGLLVSVHLFCLSGSPTRSGVQVDTQILRPCFDPFGSAKRFSRPEGIPNRAHLGLGLPGLNLTFPSRLPLPGSPTEGLELDQRTEQRVRVAQAVGLVARPAVFPQIRHHPSAKRIGLDVPQDNQKMVVVLDHGTFEPTLPHMADRAMPSMIAPGVRNRQGLEDAADRLPGTRTK